MWVQVPEMQRAELSSTVLRLKALGVDNMMTFDWLAPPPAETMIRALELLHALGALDASARWAYIIAAMLNLTISCSLVDDRCCQGVLCMPVMQPGCRRGKVPCKEHSGT